MRNKIIVNQEQTEIVLYSGDEKAGYNHFKYWLPVFIKAGVRFSLLVRNEKLQAMLQKDYATIFIRCAVSPLDVEQYLNQLPKLRTIFYMSNANNNIHLLRFNMYKHIYLGSENSDSDAQVTKVLRAYDELWLSSQSAIDKLAVHFDVTPLTIKLIGKPQIESLLPLHAPVSKTILVRLTMAKVSSELLISIIDALDHQGYHADLVLDQKYDARQSLGDVYQQLQEYIQIKGLRCRLVANTDSYSLTPYESIICDVDSYSYKLLASGANILLFCANGINNKVDTGIKYLPLDAFAKFDDANSLIAVLNNTASQNIKAREIAEYWLGVSAVSNHYFLREIQSC